jgi:hypothetical protein
MMVLWIHMNSLQLTNFSLSFTVANDAPVAINTGHEVNIPAQQPQQTTYAAAENMEGQDEDTTTWGMPQPFDAPTDNNDGQSHDNTVQGTSEPDDAPKPPLSPSCKCILFIHSLSIFCYYTSPAANLLTHCIFYSPPHTGTKCSSPG